MSWTSELYKIYDLERDIVGRKIDGVVLLPLFHSSQNAQIEVTIFDDGTFSHAEIVDEEDKMTVIPVTEDSSARSSGVTPHSLCDKLKYVAGDYCEYTKDNGKNREEYFEKYIFKLSDWVNSDFSDALIESVYNYLKKGDLIRDLINYGIFRLDENGKYLDEKYKILKTEQSECFIRFIVTNKSDNSTFKVWENLLLYEKYINYCNSKDTNSDLCYITGDVVPVSYKHMAKIRYSGDSAKLLSSNDKSGLTYRGRFSDEKEAYSVGKIASQKVHLALKWLIERQGTSIGSGKFVTWESNMKKIPDINEESASYWDDEEFDDETKAKTSPQYCRMVNKAIRGYFDKLNPNSKIMVMFVDAASPGRLSILCYQEFSATDYFKNLQNWYTKVYWHYFYFRDKKRIDCIGTPNPKTIIECAYGNEQNGKFSLKDEVLTYYIKQIYFSIIYGRNIPQNILHALFNKASNPVGFNNKYNWERVVDVTCALFRKCYLESKRIGDEFDMKLNHECTDRSYLYGRLAALSDKIEQDTYDKSDNRLTNARRYMNALINSPFKIWGYIRQKINPYSEKLLKNNPGLYYYYDKIYQEIQTKFIDEEYESNKKLDAMFFMGFYAQREDLFTKKAKEETTDDGITE